MKKLFFLPSAFVVVLLFLLAACQKEQVVDVADVKPEEVTPYYYTPDINDFAIPRSGYWTTIPAGSVDALAEAIAQADPNGVIWLEAGMHTENQRVVINKKLNIIGADGAVLVIPSDDTTLEVDPGLHVLNAPGTLIKNIKIVSDDGSGWCGVMFDDSPRSAILGCEISEFALGVIVEKSDQVAMINNYFHDCPSFGILVNNGKSVYIGNNEFTGISIGLWACDEWGTIENNNFHDNVNGLLLCKYAKEYGYLTPQGDPLGAETTATGWKLRSNEFTTNIENGLNVRDGARWNLIEMDNEYSGNGLYDISIPADEDIPNLLFVPAAYDNTIHAAPGVLIKDCGNNNTIFGGTLVDTNVDPC